MKSKCYTDREHNRSCHTYDCYDICVICGKNRTEKENANSGYPLLGEVRADVQELLQMIAEIPCTCDKIYTDRKLRAPDCPRCNWVEDDIVKKVNEHFA